MLIKPITFKIIMLFGLFVSEIILFSTLCYAAPKVSYNVKPTRGDLQTEFFVSVSVAGNNFSETNTPQFEETADISLQYLSSSVQQQIINGDVSFQKTFLYKIVFNKVLASGEYALPRGSLIVDGSKYRLPTKKIQLEASSSSQRQQGSTSSLDPLDPALNTSGQNFQFIQRVSNENPYIGEQIQYKVEIIAPENLERAQLEEFEPQGIWRERYGQDEKKIRTVQNVNINSFSESWFPIQAGEVNIPERTLRAEIREFQKRQRRPFGFGSSLGDQLLGSLMPYLSQFKTVEKAFIAKGFNLQVRPLPSPPETIKGFIPVGQIKVSSNIDSKSITLGEPLTLTIQVSGDANLRPLEIFDPKDLDKSKLKRYDDKPIISKNIGESNVIFYKTFKIALIPVEEGLIKTPSFEVNWFNPVNATYEKYLTESYLIEVKNDGKTKKVTSNTPLTQATSAANLDKVTELKNQKLTVNYIKKIPYLKRTTSIKLAAFAFLLSIIISISNLIRLFFLSSSYKQKQHYNKLKNELLVALNKQTSSEIILAKFRSLLAAKTGSPLDAVTADELPEKLAKFLDPQVIIECCKLFKDYEISLYSGNILNYEHTNKMIKEVLTKL